METAKLLLFAVSNRPLLVEYRWDNFDKRTQMSYGRRRVNLTVTLHKSEKCNKTSACAAYSISAVVPFVQRALEPALR